VLSDLNREAFVELQVDIRFLRGISQRAERSEVVLVVPRPGGKVLLHTKSFYPCGVYRLLTGRMHPGESSEDAFAREFREEIGRDAGPSRMLGVIRYRFASAEESADFISYVYVTPEVSYQPQPEDEEEQITGFRDVPADELRTVAGELRGLPEDWRDWGRFRAVAHDFVSESLPMRNADCGMGNGGETISDC
jgi:8-oxo-dGTP pyrophosphatase MutT (NUDIX family)